VRASVENATSMEVRTSVSMRQLRAGEDQGSRVSGPVYAGGRPKLLALEHELYSRADHSPRYSAPVLAPDDVELFLHVLI
jgi:hypothetical protein